MDDDLAALRRRRRRRRLLRVVMVVLLCTLLVPAAAGGYVAWRLSTIPKFDSFTPATPRALASLPPASPSTVKEASLPPDEIATTAPPDPEDFGSGYATYLIFSTGTDNLSYDQALDLGVSDPDLRGDDLLTDTIAVLVVNRDTNSADVFSIPRDTYVPDYGEKINAMFAIGGPQLLADTVADFTGLRIDHMVRVNMAAFVALTDAVGGVNLLFDQSGRDLNTGLVTTAGLCDHFDGRRALALVRSRHFEVLTEDGFVETGDGDFGRIGRQQMFLAALAGKLAGSDLVLRVPELLGIAAENVTLDPGFSVREMTDLARRLRDSGAGAVKFSMIDGDVGFAGAASVVFVDYSTAREFVASTLAEHSARAAAEPAPPQNTPAPTTPPESGPPCLP